VDLTTLTLLRKNGDSDIIIKAHTGGEALDLGRKLFELLYILVHSVLMEEDPPTLAQLLADV
jgi:hypothetical protein